MVNQIPTLQIPSNLGNTTALQNINQQASNHIPIAGKINDERNRAVSSLGVFGGGMLGAHLLGKLLKDMGGPDGAIINTAKKISANPNAIKVNNWLSKLDLGTKIGKVTKAFKNFITSSKYIHAENVNAYGKTFKRFGGLKGSAIMEVADAQIAMKTATRQLNVAQKALQAAQKANNAAQVTKLTEQITKLGEKIVTSKASAKAAAANVRPIANTMKEVSKLGVLGKFFGNTGLFLQKHLSTKMGLFNGLFAAMTINGVIQAKKGEKFSTFMQDFLGTWIGSLGGYTLVARAQKALLSTFVNKSGVVTKSGLLPTMAKVLSKTPGWVRAFVIPMVGCIAISSLLEKVSHKLFGKPSDPVVEEAKQNQAQGATTFNGTTPPAANETMDSWLKQQGWDKNAFNQVKQDQVGLINQPSTSTNNPINTNQQTVPAQKNNPVANPNNSGYTGYMPVAEIPQAVTGGADNQIGQLTSSIDETLADIEAGLARHGIQI